MGTLLYHTIISSYLCPKILVLIHFWKKNNILHMNIIINVIKVTGVGHSSNFIKFNANTVDGFWCFM